jgi:anti-anti-sigma factor
MSEATVEAHDEGGRVQIVLRGDVDLANADAVEDAFAAAISNRTTAATVDLTAVTYLDSAGMRILFALASRLRTLQIKLELVAPHGAPARRVIELSGLPWLASLQPPADPELD